MPCTGKEVRSLINNMRPISSYCMCSSLYSGTCFLDTPQQQTLMTLTITDIRLVLSVSGQPTSPVYSKGKLIKSGHVVYTSTAQLHSTQKRTGSPSVRNALLSRIPSHYIHWSRLALQLKQLALLFVLHISTCLDHVVNNNLYLLSVACVSQRFPEHNHKELIKNLNQKCRDAGKTDIL